MTYHLWRHTGGDVYAVEIDAGARMCVRAAGPLTAPTIEALERGAFDWQPADQVLPQGLFDLLDYLYCNGCQREQPTRDGNHCTVCGGYLNRYLRD